MLSSTAGQELDVDDYFFFVDEGGNPLYDPDIDDQFDAVFVKLASNSISRTIKIAGPGEGAVWAGRQSGVRHRLGIAVVRRPFPDQLREVKIGTTRWPRGS